MPARLPRTVHRRRVSEGKASVIVCQWRYTNVLHRNQRHLQWQRDQLKKPVSKADLRDELQRETERFLKQGGHVQNIPSGISGKDPGDPPLFLNRRLFIEPRGQRTLVPEVVAAIEARRRQKNQRKPQRKPSRLPRPRRKIIYDDFGEPLRKVWVDE